MSENLVEKGQESTGEDSRLSIKLMWVFAAGFILVFLGVLVIIVAAAFWGNGSASSGIIIFVGPFPIVFGAGPDAIWMVLIGIILSIISVVVFVVMRRKING